MNLLDVQLPSPGHRQISGGVEPRAWVYAVCVERHVSATRQALVCLTARFGVVQLCVRQTVVRLPWSN